MIYSEGIEAEGMWARFERQKDDRYSKWYGQVFIYKDKDAKERHYDGLSWVVDKVVKTAINKKYKKLRKALSVEWSREECELFRKVAVEADALGWFDDVK